MREIADRKLMYQVINIYNEIDGQEVYSDLTDFEIAVVVYTTLIQNVELKEMYENDIDLIDLEYNINSELNGESILIESTEDFTLKYSEKDGIEILE